MDHHSELGYTQHQHEQLTVTWPPASAAEQGAADPLSGRYHVSAGLGVGRDELLMLVVLSKRLFCWLNCHIMSCVVRTILTSESVATFNL